MESTHLANKKAKFGVGPVFLTSITTILGAIMFLRFGYAVANVGFWGTLLMVVLAHLVTIPTAFAIAEIATNQRVEGGGMYFIISRSFGINTGAAIGVALYLSQAISVAFYIIALAEAFQPELAALFEAYAVPLEPHMQFISIPVMALLAVLMLTRGADLGVSMLYVVAAALLCSLASFWFGDSVWLQNSTEEHSLLNKLTETKDAPDNFFKVFAIIFPAFTGMAAGVGLSGDLREPRKSIPLGTLLATFSGMLIYIGIAYKLAISADSETLGSDFMIMEKLAIWSPIIPIGLACATLSSAIGSIMVAPRTLQAIAYDKVLPLTRFNRIIAKEKKKTKEPFNASVATIVIAFFFIAIGNVDFVAEIISMFFLVTYGFLCLISFFYHFSADPSYRPSFRSRWYISLLGAVMCIYFMFKINATYASLSILVMVVIYASIINYQRDPSRKGLANIFTGAIFQLSRLLHVFLQKANRNDAEANWRPAVVCVSSSSFRRYDSIQLMRWISHRYGFGTYIHYVEGYLSRELKAKAADKKNRLLKIVKSSKSNVVVNTMVSPSYTSCIAQALQAPSVSGMEHNMILFEYLKTSEDDLLRIVNNYSLVNAMDFDICILEVSQRQFGLCDELHVWMEASDEATANTMILLAYIIMGHPDWKRGQIKIFATCKEAEMEKWKNELTKKIKVGRLPIAPQNIELISTDEIENLKKIICEKSVEADLTIIGFRSELLKGKHPAYFQGYDDLGNILFVSSSRQKLIN